MIIFSDLHAHNFTEHHPDRLGLIADTLAKILSDAHLLGCPVLFCGDMVHKHGYVPTPVITKLLDVFLAYRDITVYAISGNHDQTYRNRLGSGFDAGSFITTLSMALPNFHNIDYKNIIIDDYEVIGVPYLDRSQDFDIVLENIVQLPKRTKYRILLCHQTPAGLFNSFIPVTFDIHDPRLKDFDYVFTGHIHRYQDFGKNRYMVGNPIVQDASDCGDSKGYLYLKDGQVQRVILESILDEAVVEHLDTRKKAVAKVEKTTAVDHRFYSEDQATVFTAFCEAVQLEHPTVEIGKKLMFG